jgi:hypothetical protein
MESQFARDPYGDNVNEYQRIYHAPVYNWFSDPQNDFSQKPTDEEKNAYYQLA